MNYSTRKISPSIAHGASDRCRPSQYIYMKYARIVLSAHTNRLPPVLIRCSLICTTLNSPMFYRLTHMDVQAASQKLVPVKLEWMNP